MFTGQYLSLLDITFNQAAMGNSHLSRLYLSRLRSKQVGFSQWPFAKCHFPIPHGPEALQPGVPVLLGWLRHPHLLHHPIDEV